MIANRNIYNDGEYLDKNPSWHIEDSPWKAGKVVAALRNTGIDPRSICEVGCGAGVILAELQTKLGGARDFVGYDISPQAIARASLLQNDRLRFVNGDIAHDDHPYDLMLIMDVIEHLEDYFGFLRNVKSKAEYKIFHIPLDLSVRSVFRVKPLEKVRRQYGHIHLFTKETALAALTDAGYEILSATYTCKSFDLVSSSLKEKLEVRLRRIMFALNADFTVRLMGRASLLVVAR